MLVQVKNHSDPTKYWWDPNSSQKKHVKGSLDQVLRMAGRLSGVRGAVTAKAMRGSLACRAGHPVLGTTS